MQVTAQLSEAVSKLFEEHLIPHLPEAAKTPADMFRHRLYCQVILALSPVLALLIVLAPLLVPVLSGDLRKSLLAL
eukprot:scaffold11042_cov18-Tisochrysis_lutea.AAC.1